MIAKKIRGFSKMIWIIIIACTTLATLNLILSLVMEKDDDTPLRLMISFVLFGLIALLFIKNYLINNARYKKLCNQEGEYEMERLEAEYQAGRKTKEVVFGDKHLFIELETGVGFDIINYQDIFWMYLDVHTTKINFIPLVKVRQINIYLDEPKRKGAQVVHINAKDLYHKDSLNAFFAEIKEKNPNILLGYNLEWARMQITNKEALIRLANSQKEVK